MHAVDSEDAAVGGEGVGGWVGGGLPLCARSGAAPRCARAKTRRCHISRDRDHIKMQAAAEWLTEQLPGSATVRARVALPPYPRVRRRARPAR